MIAAQLRRGFSSPAATAQRLQRELSELLRVEEARKELSHRFRVMPHYLQSSFVRRFARGRHYQNYLRHALEGHSLSGLDQDQPFECGELVGFVGLRGGRGMLEGFLSWLMGETGESGFARDDNDLTMEMCRFRRPDKWFQVKHEGTERRVFVYHHGPTNSGKSTAAVEELKGLSQQQKGIYMAPLRLLAWEYQQKLGGCDLITGQEKQYNNSNLVSCTIEAAPLTEDYEVAVVDEIQMIADEERGWAWTKAILTLRARRIHLCGDERALGVVSKILELTGDRLEERRYSRLSKLSLIHRPFELKNIAPGDTVINFSKDALVRHRNDINAMLAQQQSGQAEAGKEEEGEGRVENRTAMVYGKLPSEVRRAQAVAFNEGRLPYLVATNAIGMGLNLNISKVVFVSLHRSTKKGVLQELEEHEIQQIAGRAGRGTETGYVQCTSPAILSKVQKALRNVNQTYGIQLEDLKEGGEEESEGSHDGPLLLQAATERYSSLLGRRLTPKECHIDKACLFFLVEFLRQFKLQLWGATGAEPNIVDLLAYLRGQVELSELYFIQANSMFGYLMDLLETSNYDLEELFTFYNGLSLSLGAVGRRSPHRQLVEYYHREFINNFVKYRRVEVPQALVELHARDYEGCSHMDSLAELEGYHSLLESYIWLWNKFEFAFHQIALAKQIKAALVARIDRVLTDNRFKQPPTPSHQYPSFAVKQPGKPNRVRRPRPSKVQPSPFTVTENQGKGGLFAQSQGSAGEIPLQPNPVQASTLQMHLEAGIPSLAEAEGQAPTDSKQPSSKRQGKRKGRAPPSQGDQAFEEEMEQMSLLLGGRGKK